MKLTRREGKLLKGLGLILFLMLYIKFGVLPLYDKFTESVAEKEIVNEKLESARNALATEAVLDKEIDAYQVKTDKYLEKYFASSKQEDLVLLVNEFTKVEPQVTALEFEKMQKVTRGDMEFDALGSTLSTRGSYPATVQLLRTVWNFPKHIGVDNMTIKREDDGAISSAVDLAFYWVPNAPDNRDALVQWIEDETFYKANPYIGYEGDPNRVNYVYIGGDEDKLAALFNKPFVDLAGHWAQGEIETFRKAGYVIADAENRFKPDEPMTRGEFLILLDKIYQWPAPEGSVDLTKYSDYSTLGSYEGPIAKAIFKGYLGGYVIGFTDNTLRPRDPITYEDMAYVLSKIKNDPAFSWKPVGDKLQLERGFVSPGLADPKLPMSRAEVVFMMTYFK